MAQRSYTNITLIRMHIFHFCRFRVQIYDVCRCSNCVHYMAVLFKLSEAQFIIFFPRCLIVTKPTTFHFMRFRSILNYAANQSSYNKTKEVPLTFSVLHFSSRGAHSSRFLPHTVQQVSIFVDRHNLHSTVFRYYGSIKFLVCN